MKLFFLSQVITLPMTLAWGPAGHAIIAGLMKPLLSPQGLRFIITHSGDGYELDQSINWPDSDEANTRYPGSDKWHYSFTPYRTCDTFSFDRDCVGGECVVTGIARSAEIISDPSVSENIRKDYMNFFLHFMGDIHQPLHTGFRKDHGGLDIKLLFPLDATLHDVWDSEIISRMIGGVSESNIINFVSTQSEKLLHNIEYRRLHGWSERPPAVNNCTFQDMFVIAADIASDTTTTVTCSEAYVDLEKKYIESNSTLSRNLLKARATVAVKQLTKAAIRTANIIDQIAKIYYARKKAMKASAVVARQNIQDRNSMVTSSVQVQSELKRENMFASLLLEFDPDEIVELWKPTEDLSVDSVEVPVTKPSKKKTKKSSGSAAESPTREMFEGVDLERIVLVRLLGATAYTLTYREYAERRGAYSTGPTKKVPFEPMDVVTFSVSVENGSFLLNLDGSIFGSNPKKEVVVRCLLRLKGIKLDPSTSIGIFMESEDSSEIEISALETKLPPGTVLVQGTRKISMDARPTDLTDITLLLRDRFFTRMRRMEEKRVAQGYMTMGGYQMKCYKQASSVMFRFIHRGVLFLLHPDTIKLGGPVTRFNIHSLTEGDTKINFVVDPLVFDGSLPFEIISTLQSREKVNNGRGIIRYRGMDSLVTLIDRYRPSFWEEIETLVDVLQGLSRPARHIAWVLMHPGDNENSFRVFYYILTGTPQSAFLDHTESEP